MPQEGRYSTGELSLVNLTARTDIVDSIGAAEPLPPPPVMLPPAGTSPHVPTTADEDEHTTTQHSPIPDLDFPDDGAATDATIPGNLSSIFDSKTVIAGRYEVEEAIGEGGMGRVYRVQHSRLGKHFALKLMRTKFSGDTKLRASFYREARLASSLAHPNIVSIIDFGEDAKMGAFMVMELLVGEPLSVRQRNEGRFPLRVACEILLEVGGALHYMHKRHIVHCDIKADNILLCEIPDAKRRKRQAKLLDFGLARFGSTSTQKAKKVDGTPEYMAPERIRGQEPNPSMDIYGLGVLAYELVTGRLPFRGKVTQVLEKHIKEQPPSIASILGKPIDERVEQLVMKAMAKKPRDRQRDMAAFLYELRTLMDMLGYRQGRRITTRVRAAVPAINRRDHRARVAFDVAPLPMASINVDGTVVLANRAFRKFVTGESKGQIEGTNAFDSKFVEVYPGFSSDVRRAHVDGKTIQRELFLQTNDGQQVQLLLWLVAGLKGHSDVYLTISPNFPISSPAP